MTGSSFSKKKVPPCTTLLTLYQPGMLREKPKEVTNKYKQLQCWSLNHQMGSTKEKSLMYVLLIRLTELKDLKKSAPSKSIPSLKDWNAQARTASMAAHSPSFPFVGNFTFSEALKQAFSICFGSSLLKQHKRKA